MKILTETTAAPVKRGKRWLVTVAVPGQGSSGVYSEDVLREQGPAALAPGAQSFITHETRNPKDMIGTYPEGAFWNNAEGKLQAELEVFPHWEEFVEAVASHTGMSIQMAGEKDDDNNVTKLIPSVSNRCDMVDRPGLAGSGIDKKLYEQLLEEARNPSREDDNTVKELEDKIASLTVAVTALVDGIKAKEAADEAANQVVADAETAVEAYDAAVEQILAAKLSPKQTADLRAKAKAGEDVEAAIETAKEIAKELTEAATKELEEAAPTGRVTFTEKDIKSAVDLGKVFG